VAARRALRLTQPKRFSHFLHFFSNPTAANKKMSFTEEELRLAQVRAALAHL